MRVTLLHTILGSEAEQFSGILSGLIVCGALCVYLRLSKSKCWPLVPVPATKAPHQHQGSAGQAFHSHMQAEIRMCGYEKLFGCTGASDSNFPGMLVLNQFYILLVVEEVSEWDKRIGKYGLWCSVSSVFLWGWAPPLPERGEQRGQEGEHTWPQVKENISVKVTRML